MNKQNDTPKITPTNAVFISISPLIYSKYPNKGNAVLIIVIVLILVIILTTKQTKQMIPIQDKLKHQT